MHVTATQIAALLEALGLTQSIFKPIPDLLGGLTAPLDPIVSSVTAPLDGVVSTVDGITRGLGLPGLSDLPLIGSILGGKEASNTGYDQNPFQSLNLGQRQQLLSSDGSCVVKAYNPPPVLSQTFPPFDQSKATIYRYRQQQAVNLGSWFVHEQWMTPSLFTCASGQKSAELDIASGWGNTTGARAVLEHHWDTFITQSDFQYLASIGINTVRLPIGYWSLGPYYCQETPFGSYADVYANSWSRVVRAINWAGESGIGVLIDLHGAPGSQNGQSHSGVSDGQANFFRDALNQDATINVLTFLTQQLASVTNVVGIQILNEPNDDPALPDFYNRAINSMRRVSTEAATLPIYIHDAFNLDEYSDFIASRDDFIVEDHHSYFVYSQQDLSRDADGDTQFVDSTLAGQLSSASAKLLGNLIIGEWSCALSRDSLSGMDDPLLARQQFCQSQEQVYANTTAGWHFWSYTKEGCDNDLDWCFKNAVANTLPSSFYAYNTSAHTTPAKSFSLARAVAEMKLPSMKEVLDQGDDQASSWDSTDETSSSEGSDDSDDTMISDANQRKRSVGSVRERFFSIHARRTLLSKISGHKRDGVPSLVGGLTSVERSMAKGYADGFLTAKIFAQYGLSKLGFTGQYIKDSIAKLSPGFVAPGTEDSYTSSFYRGLSDGEDLVRTAALA